MNTLVAPIDDWSDEVLFEEIKNYNRIQNKISELENKKHATLKPLHKQRHEK